MCVSGFIGVFFNHVGSPRLLGETSARPRSSSRSRQKLLLARMLGTAQSACDAAVRRRGRVWWRRGRCTSIASCLSVTRRNGSGWGREWVWGGGGGMEVVDAVKSERIRETQLNSCGVSLCSALTSLSPEYTSLFPPRA